MIFVAETMLHAKFISSARSSVQQLISGVTAVNITNRNETGNRFPIVRGDRTEVD